ncbi:hypothetical protein [Microbacterium murale]|nr:hypothetical protein [Microbacterium murale]
MSTLTPRRRIEARIRRIVSLAVSAFCGVILVANTVLFVERPSTFFTDGAFGLTPIPTLLVHALRWTPVAAAAAVLIVGTMPEAAKGSPPVDPLPGRLPMIAAVVVLCVSVAFLAVPSVILIASIMAVVLVPIL